MNREKIIYIKPRFWPKKEGRFLPIDEVVDWENPDVMKVLKFRNGIRNYYRNWVTVWRTYEFYSKWALAIVPLVMLVTWNLWVAAFALVLWIVAKLIIRNRLDRLHRIRFFNSWIT